MDQHIIDGLSPGIKTLVLWLNTNGFQTIDSGDGSNAAAGMGCAIATPMVAILTCNDHMAQEADRLMTMLETRGVDFTAPPQDCADPEHEVTWPSIQASYDPGDGNAVIVLLNVTSEDIGL